MSQQAQIDAAEKFKAAPDTVSNPPASSVPQTIQEESDEEEQVCVVLVRFDIRRDNSESDMLLVWSMQMWCLSGYIVNSLSKSYIFSSYI